MKTEKIKNQIYKGKTVEQVSEYYELECLYTEILYEYCNNNFKGSSHLCKLNSNDLGGKLPINIKQANIACYIKYLENQITELKNKQQ
jgi:hypothetical protein